MLPTLLEYGPLKIHSWGVLLMLGFLLGTWRAVRNAHRYKIDTQDVWDVGLWGLLGGVIGARLAFVLLNVGYFRLHPAEILHIWTGGMTFYGGLAGGVLAGVLLCRARGIRVGDMADLIAPSFAIGYALGRVGCFLNGCCYGGLCEPPLGMRFHQPEGGLTPPSHPAQLYAAVAGLLMYFVLTRLEPHRRFPGQLMLVFVGLYGVYRFLVEFVREGVTAETTRLLGLTQGQIASFVLVLFVAALYGLASRRGSRSATPKATPSAV